MASPFFFDAGCNAGDAFRFTLAPNGARRRITSCANHGLPSKRQSVYLQAMEHFT
jgi:hypothetical protein